MENIRLETIEWTQYWTEHAPDRETPRVLLIGDSISVGYRHEVEGRLGGKYHVSAMSTSKAVDNPFFLDEVALLRKQEKDYDVIHFNNGAHGGHLDADTYEKHYEALLRGLMEMFPGARLILALTTPVMKKEALAEFDPVQNARVLERNERVRAINARLGLGKVDDLYQAALSAPDLHGPDGLHFKEQGYAVLADAVAKSILK